MGKRLVDDPNQTLPSLTTEPSRGYGVGALAGTGGPGGHVAGAELAAGTRIHQYELLRELGRGGMGCVYAARDTRLGRKVAIKFLLQASKSVAERFLVEARATAQCNHENIVIVHEVDEADGRPYMVLEYLDGQTLRDVMRAGCLPPGRTVELALAIARALARAHAMQIIHRDLKPENVFVTEAGQVKVLDFGIAKAYGTGETLTRGDGFPLLRDLGLTRENALVGTLPYMSPEQLGAADVDQRTDLWALGVLLFEMVTGRHPVQPLTPGNLIETAANHEVPMPSVREVIADVPEPLARIVDGLLRKNKDERVPASAEQVARELEELVPGRDGRALADGESPYPGLVPFQEADADRYFGRARDVARMVARLRERPLTGVIGPSGIGKSSFVRAGVGPALKASGEAWEVATLRPGRSPLIALASIMQQLTARSGEAIESRIAEHEAFVEQLRTEPGTLGSVLRSRARQTGRRILLFVDQFEELYTLVDDAAERLAFTAALSGVADDAATPLRVVVSMRSDFLDRIAEDPRFMEELGKSLVLLAQPTRASLREALLSPLSLVGYRFETPAMVDDLLGALEHTAGALPLLQFAAAKLWDARDRERRILTAASYAAMGGVVGALAAHADEVLGGMNPSSQKIARGIFERLVTPERTRAVEELDDLQDLAPDRAEITRVLDQLVAARLIVVQRRGEEAGGTAEIVHESLIERWPTLRRWLEEDQEDAALIAQLRTAAKQWDLRGRPVGLLWRGEAMDEARRWWRRHPRELPPRDRAFLDAVLALGDRAVRVRRVVAAAVFVLLAAIAASATIALFSIRGAEQAARTSARQATDQAREATVARQRAVEALDAMQTYQRERAAAEARAAEAMQRADSAKVEIAKSHEDLQMSSEELRRALGESRTLQQRASAEAAKAEAARKEAVAARAQLESLLEQERERVKRLQQERKTLSTELK